MFYWFLLQNYFLSIWLEYASMHWCEKQNFLLNLTWYTKLAKLNVFWREQMQLRKQNFFFFVFDHVKFDVNFQLQIYIYERNIYIYIYGNLRAVWIYSNENIDVYLVTSFVFCFELTFQLFWIQSIENNNTAMY